MNLFSLNPGEIEGFLMVLVRVGAIVGFMPVLGSNMIPRKVRTGLALLLTLAVYPLVKHQPLPHARGAADLAVIVASEFMLAYAIAYVARLFFSAVQLAGTLIDFQMGFGVVNVIDPQSNSQVSVIAQLQNVLAILLFLGIDGHHHMIRAMVDSYTWVNPRDLAFSGITAQYMLGLFTATFVTAAKLSAPQIVALFFISIGLALVARTVPQINVFVLGFPLQIGIGLIMTATSMAFFTQLLQSQIDEMPGILVGVMKVF